MLSRSHAAPAALGHWHDDVRAAWRAMMQGATRVARDAVSRRALAKPADRRLIDIGVTRAAVVVEAPRLPWDDSPQRRQPQRNIGPAVWRRAGTMWRRHRSRQRIGQLDAHALKDIGVSFTEAEAEANKPFWRA